METIDNLLEYRGNKMLQNYVPKVGDELIARHDREYVTGSSFHMTGPVCHTHKRGDAGKIISIEELNKSGPWKSWEELRLEIEFPQSILTYDFRLDDRGANCEIGGSPGFFSDFSIKRVLKAFIPKMKYLDKIKFISDNETRKKVKIELLIILMHKMDLSSISSIVLVGGENEIIVNKKDGGKLNILIDRTLWVSFFNWGFPW